MPRIKGLTARKKKKQQVSKRTAYSSERGQERWYHTSRVLGTKVEKDQTKVRTRWMCVEVGHGDDFKLKRLKDILNGKETF